MPEKYGIEEPMATSYLGQLAQPFRGSRKTADDPPVQVISAEPVGP
jgi:hypothetical protein